MPEHTVELGVWVSGEDSSWDACSPVPECLDSNLSFGWYFAHPRRMDGEDPGEPELG